METTVFHFQKDTRSPGENTMAVTCIGARNLSIKIPGGCWTLNIYKRTRCTCIQYKHANLASSTVAIPRCCTTLGGIMSHSPRIFYGGRNVTDNGCSKTDDARAWYVPSVRAFLLELSCKVVKDRSHTVHLKHCQPTRCQHDYHLSFHNGCPPSSRILFITTVSQII